MAHPKTTLRWHHTLIVLFCLALLVGLMQGVSYFSQNQQNTHSFQVNDMAQALAQQVAYSLQSLIENSENQDNIRQIQASLQHLVQQPRILDTTVYQLDGTVLAQAGGSVTVRDRLSLDGKRPGSYFNHQLVEVIQGKDGPIGFLRITMDTHILATEAEQVDNTTNMLRLMILSAFAIGIALSQTLLGRHHSHWQQSPYLLTANTPLEEEENDDNPSTDSSVAEAPETKKKPRT